ncbi:hypothetical protein [uncultured Brevundimonas sp.]|uniref:hypothetical protein n=1 Tax=uncultured Brevundimonas sp. TaxID=213418 RepID=UPI0025F4D7F5|nr:hypothetical protein [uncultured Brevundimonas sp.]
MIASLLSAYLLASMGPDVLLPGQADFPILRGARLAPECLEVMPADPEQPPLTCVSAPMRRANDIMWEYSRYAQSHGWQEAGGAASALFFTRPATADRCAERLTLVAFWDTSRVEAPAPNDKVFIGMMVENERCQGVSQ